MKRHLILVVEDEPMLRADAAMMLDDAGLEVVTFDTADEALAFVAVRPELVAAIFTDVQMPGRSDGLHLANFVARHWPEILVLVTSGQIRPASTLPSNVHFMPKPWSSKDVLTTLQKIAA